MAGVKFTDAQKRVIYALGGDLIISASAGSGKTTVMVERIIELILNGTELDRMLINTYTNASAADIRGKLAEKITEHIMLPEYGHTDGEKARLASQLNRVHYAEIGTLHSFCMNTLRSYFYAVGLSPDFVISDELEAGERRDRILDGVIAEKFASDEFYYIFDIFCRRRDTRELKQYIFKVYEFLRSGGRFPEKFDYGAVLCERRGDAARHYLRMLSDSLEGLSPAELEAFDAAVPGRRAVLGPGFEGRGAGRHRTSPAGTGARTSRSAP
jgi:ATP-dependent helicase/nuclease subunit A